jgi:hypothetical protein
VTFSPQFERIWLESKKRLPEHVAKEPANLALRSRYSITKPAAPATAAKPITTPRSITPNYGFAQQYNIQIRMNLV